MNRARVWVVAAVAALAGAGAARAQPDADAATGAEPATSVPAARPVPRVPLFAPTAAAKVQRLTAQQREEWSFLKEAAAASRFENDAARLALARSVDPRVRTFANILAKHHASAGNELLHLLHARGMAPPMLSNQQRMTLNRLGKMQGAKFDREFVEQVGLRHQQADLRAFEKAGAAAADPSIKAWIDRTLPAMRDHMAAAARIASADNKLAASKFITRASHPTQSMGAGPGPAGVAPR